MANSQCEYKLSEGIQCRGFAINGSAFCISHDPNAREKKRAAVMKGAKARQVREPLPPITFANAPEASAVIVTTINDIRARKITSAEAGAIIRGIKCWIRMWTGR